MRLFVFGSIVVFFSYAFACPEPAKVDRTGDQKPAPPIAAYVGMDLQKLEDGPMLELDKLLTKVLPKEYVKDEQKIFQFTPWSVWKIDSKAGEVRYVLLQVYSEPTIPGQSHGAVHLFDRSGKPLSSVQFPAGNRIWFDSATFRHEPILKVPVIDFRCSGFQGITRQVYGLIDDRVALLRMEDEDGNLAMNWNSRVSHFVAGPPAVKRSAAEWEQALDSPEPVVVLEALVWLASGSRHTVVPNLQGVAKKELSSGKLAAVVLTQSSVQQRVKELARSKNEWLRQAANRVLKPPTWEDVRAR